MDEQALDLLRVRITNWATSRLRSRQGAEDVAQEVLLELTRKYPDKIHLEELLPLAYRIMGVKLNSAIRKRIKRGNDGSTESIELESPEQGAEESLLGKERKQLLFKVLDGCSINDRYWVFFAATTDVQFTATVTDTQSGAQRTYTNPQGQAADAVTDTAAFASCP